MSVIVLAENDGQVWIVQGDEYVDALLFNELPPDVTVEFVPCATRAEVFTMWNERSPQASTHTQPWLINPAITNRIRASLGTLVRGMRFAPWSAALDEAAQGELAGAAAWLEANPGGRLLLRQFAPEAPVPGHADLQRLRGQLATQALLRAGVPAEAVGEETASADKDADADRLEVVTKAPAA